jgi:formylglycine-generating enzyme required for sulfatase activity
VLEQSLNEVVSCGKVDSHFYSLSYGHCYWCDRHQNLGLDIFPGKAINEIVVSSPPKPPKITPKLPSQPKIGKRFSVPQIAIPLPPPIQKWPRRKVLIGLGAGIVTTTGITIFAQPRLSFAKPTPFTEQLSDEIELTMVGLPGGKFLMGSPESGIDELNRELPQHEVTVPSFAIGKYPVTQAQWQAIMGSNSEESSNEFQHPVQVSWYRCHKFCKKLSSLTGNNYRLPSEAEWEYACRAGTQTHYSFGDDVAQLGDYAWYYVNNPSKKLIHPVGQKKPNSWGLYDMHGNIREWCEDDWHKNYQGAPRNGSPRTTIISSAFFVDTDYMFNVVRGTYSMSTPFYCRSSSRAWARRGREFSGFRLVMG